MIKSNGGVFGRNPTFQNVTVDGNLTVNGDLALGDDITINDTLLVSGVATFNGGIVSTGTATAPTSNTVIGSGAGAALEAGGTNNTLVGLNAGALITTADDLTAIGSGALDANTSGINNTAVGRNALGSNVTNQDCTAVGNAALALSTGDGNTAVGSRALDAITTGAVNVALGRDAFGALTTGSGSVAIGAAAGQALTTSGSVVAIGTSALSSATTLGNSCIAIGFQAFGPTTTATGSIAIGSNAGRYHGAFPSTSSLTSATESVFIGTGSRAQADSQTNQIVIAGNNGLGNGSNTTTIGTSNTAATHLHGPSMFSVGANGQSTRLGQATQLLTGLTGATVTATNLIPANCILLGVTARVTTAITGATTFDIGDGTTANRFGDDIAIAVDTTANNCIAPALIAAATNVVLTANGSNFTAGAVRVTAHFMTIVAPTS